MKILLYYITVFLLIFPCSVLRATDQPFALPSEIWVDAEHKYQFIKANLTAVRSEEGVRAITAGTLRSAMLNSYVYPAGMVFDDFEGFPSLAMLGVSYMNLQPKDCVIRLVFSDEATYMIICLSPTGMTAENPKGKFKYSGKPSQFTAGVFAELKPIMEKMIPDLQKIVSKRIESLKEKANQALLPTTTPVMSPARQEPRQP
jgi:hypothetical protein